MSAGELLAVFSYSLVTALLESLAFLLILLVLCFILPSAWLRDAFVVRGGLISLGVLGVILLRAYLNTTPLSYLKDLGALGAAGGAAALLLTALSSRVGWLAQAVAWLADRLIVFLYILIPLSGVGLIMVLVRNVL